MNSLGVVQSNGGDTRSALETTRRALELSLEGGGGDTPRCYVNVSTFEFDCGLLEEAAAHQREGLALSSRVGAAFTAEWLEAEIACSTSTAARGTRRCDRSFSELRRRQEQGEFRYMDTQLRMAELEVSLSRAGRLDAEALEATLESVRAVGDPQLLLPVSGAGSLLLASEGLIEEARALLHEYHDGARSTMLPSGPWDVSAALAWRLVYGTQAPVELHARNVMPWGEAAELVCRGEYVAAAGVLAGIGARAVEAQVRLEAARSPGGLGPRRGVAAARARLRLLARGAGDRTPRIRRGATGAASSRRVLGRERRTRPRSVRATRCVPPSTIALTSRPSARRMLAATAARGPVSQTVTTGRSRGRSAAASRTTR